MEIWMSSEKQNMDHTENEAFEVCVLCGSITSVPKTRDVDLRSDYLAGAGQLCHECALEIIASDRAMVRDGFLVQTIK